MTNTLLRPENKRCRETAPPWFRRSCVALGLIAFTAPVVAQSLLSIKTDGKIERVLRTDGDTGCVLEDGKSAMLEGANFILKPTAEYLPVSISVLNQYFKKGATAISDNGPANERLIHAGRFVFNADFQAPCALDNVVLALELVSKKDGNSLYIRGLGHLDAYQVKHISIDVITPYKLKDVHFGGLHLFVDGRETFNSKISVAKREFALDRMVASRTAAVRDAGPRPLVLVDPIYPAALKTKTSGRAVIAISVDQNGKVLNPSVRSATDPAFGAAAIEAIVQWRFVPRVKDGNPVESAVEVPFNFPAPS
jgi:TonB family protein